MKTDRVTSAIASRRGVLLTLCQFFSVVAFVAAEPAPHEAFDAAVRSYEQRGIPVTPDEAWVAEQLEGQSASELARRAVAAWPRVGDPPTLITDTAWYRHEGQEREFLTGKPIGDPISDPVGDAIAYLRDVEVAIKLLGFPAPDAPRHSGVRWEERISLTLSSDDLLENATKLSNLLRDSAGRALDHGRPALAVDLIRQMYGIATLLRATPSTVNHYLRAVSLHASADSAVEDLFPRMSDRMMDPPLGQALQRLLDATDNEIDGVNHLKHTMSFERVRLIDTVRAVIDDDRPFDEIEKLVGRSDREGGLSRDEVKDLTLRLASEAFDLIDATQAAASISNIHDLVFEYDTVSPDRLKARAKQTGADQRLLRELVFQLAAIQRIRFQALARTRLARVAIALKRHRVVAGSESPDLASLVPGNLRAVPGDPFALDHRPLSYLPEGVRPRFADGSDSVVIPDAPKLPVIYSLGLNGEDDGGYVLMRSTGEVDDTAPFRDDSNEPPVDQWYLLTLPPSVPPRPSWY